MLPLLLAGAVAATSVAAPIDPVLGTWINPKGTLAVRTTACQQALCGVIVRASDKARADVRDSGGRELIGTELLQDYHAAGRGAWAGRIFVPDLGRSFSSRIRQTAPDRLTISGCLIAGLFCRSQEWRRATP